MANEELLAYLRSMISNPGKRFSWLTLDRTAYWLQSNLAHDQFERLSLRLADYENSDYWWLAVGIEGLGPYLRLILLGEGAGENVAKNMEDSKVLFDDHNAEYSRQNVLSVIAELQGFLNKELKLPSRPS